MIRPATTPTSTPVPASGFVSAVVQPTAQQQWGATPVAQRLRVLRSIRHLLAEHHDALVNALSPELARTPADTLAAEVLPLLAACKFLEQEAASILAPRSLGRRGLPLWLSGLDARVERVPYGTILVIAPANYPLLLPGVQVLQALAAGNAAVWKPGRGGLAIAQEFAALCSLAGLPQGLLRITDESVESAIAEIEAQPGLIIFTGSAAAGREVQRLAAERSIPVIAELSGCDAVFVLPTADSGRVLDALCFGMRLNGSATCMAPRRLILVGGNNLLLDQLQTRFAAMQPVFLSDTRRLEIAALLADASAHGGLVSSQPEAFAMKPILIRNGSSQMKLAQVDFFAPVLTAITVTSVADAVALEQQSPFGLTAAIFGDASDARTLAAQLTVGTVLINDLIVPTADPRVPFGGRKASGFGVTRGREGLLAMTAARTVSTRTGDDRRHYLPTTHAHAELFAGAIAMTHSRGLAARFAGLKRLIQAARTLK